MKKILLINGHPSPESFNAAISEHYKQSARLAGAQVDELNIRELNFNPNLAFGYSKRTELEPDLLAAWEKIKHADHLVFIFPMWWGSMPAIMKGFFDRLFIPGFAFKYRENSALWDKLLVGKTAHIICTTDYPVFYYKWVLREPGIKTMRKMILGFCGIRTKRVTYLGPIRNSTEAYRKKLLLQTAELAKKQR